MRYRKKPVVIDAIQWDGSVESATKILHWMFPDIEPDAIACGLTIATLEGEMKASKGDWIIKGIKGEFYPCKPDVFAATYEPVE